METTEKQLVNLVIRKEKDKLDYQNKLRAVVISLLPFIIKSGVVVIGLLFIMSVAHVLFFTHEVSNSTIIR